jgi:hypothetical protein
MPEPWEPEGNKHISIAYPEGLKHEFQKIKAILFIHLGILCEEVRIFAKIFFKEIGRDKR